MLKIGIFDSGVGGLTVAKAIYDLLPNVHITYFGDSIHLPYGNKSKINIINYSLQSVNFLLKQQVQAIVIACNTATAIAKPSLLNHCNIPIFGVIEPGAKVAINQSINKRIGIIGTHRTIESKSYSQKILELDKSFQVFEKACPLLVPIIEEGIKNINITKLVLQEYLSSLMQKKIDTLVLGCTHYPLIKSIISQEFPTIKVIDSAISVAYVLKHFFLSQEKETNQSFKSINIYTNDLNEVFEKICKKLFFKTPIQLTV